MAWKILHHPFKCKTCCGKTPRRFLNSAFFNKIQKFIGKRVILIDNLDNGVKTTIFSSFMSKLCTFMMFYNMLLISTKFKSFILRTLTRIWRIGREVIVQICTSWYFIKIWRKKQKFSWVFLLSRTVTLVKDYLQNLKFDPICQIDQ